MIAYTGFGRRNDRTTPRVSSRSTATASWSCRAGDHDRGTTASSMALRCVTCCRSTPIPRSASITSTTTAGRPTCRGFGVDSRWRRRFRAICRPAEVAALEAAGIPAAATGDPACTVVDLPAFDRLQTPANIARLAPIVGGVAQATALSAQNATNAACATAAGRAGTAFVDYPKHIKLWGIGASAGLPGGVALQGEYSYRGNQPLQLPAAEVLLAVAGAGNQLTGTDPDVASQDALRHRDHRLPQGRDASGAGDRDQGVRPDRWARARWWRSRRSAIRTSTCRAT